VLLGGVWFLLALELPSELDAEDVASATAPPTRAAAATMAGNQLFQEDFSLNGLFRL
jgi:hypothetical protein